MQFLEGFLGNVVIKNLLVNAGDPGDMGSIPESGKSPGVGNGKPPQYYCLENTVDRGAIGYSPCFTGLEMTEPFNMCGF